MQPDPTSSPPSALPHVFPVADAYVKPVEQDGRRMYAIHDQHGKPLAMAPSREVAFAYLGQQEIGGVDAH